MDRGIAHATENTKQGKPPPLPWDGTAAQLLAPLAPRVLEVELTGAGAVRLGDDPGSTLRSVLGRALKQVCCPTPQDCRSACARIPECVFGIAFEPPPALDSAHHVTERPRPLVVRSGGPAATDLAAGRPWTVEILLLGPMRTQVPALVAGLDRAGELGLGTPRTRFRRTADRVLELLSNRDPASPTVPGPVREVEVNFVTRTRLVRRGSVTRDIDFETLMRAILRRYSALMAAYAGGEPDWNYRRIIERARRVETADSRLRFADSRRWSSRQRRSIPKGGLVGTVRYRGELDPFRGLLGAAAWLHAGKGTVLGHGRLVVRPIPAA